MYGTALDEDSHEDYENYPHQHASPPILLQCNNKYINKKEKTQQIFIFKTWIFLKALCNFSMNTHLTNMMNFQQPMENHNSINLSKGSYFNIKPLQYLFCKKNVTSENHPSGHKINLGLPCPTNLTSSSLKERFIQSFKKLGISCSINNNVDYF